jgi:polyhydroxybutyrate depolymerase
MTVPDSTTPQSPPHPVLIAMHGYGGNGRGMRNMIGLKSGFENGYVVLYPDGAGSNNGTRGWNSGHPDCCGTALRDNVDDVAFLRALVDEVARETCVDLNRVFATGFSNGGDMAQRLACDASDVFAAVTSVAGRFDYHASACPGKRPVPAVLYRGQRDRTVPYEGSLLGLSALKTIPAVEGFEQIANKHRCGGKPINTLTADDTDCLRIDDCDPGFEITLCTSADAGHCWPGIGGCSGTREGGDAVFSASDHMQDFFTRHAQSH